MITILASTVLTCLSLTAIDGDTIRCNGQRMRDMGPGSPNVSGYDAPEIGRAQCAKERLLGEQARLRPINCWISPAHMSRTTAGAIVTAGPWWSSGCETASPQERS